MPGVYDVNMLGFNYRMNEIEAALGIEQLKRVDSFLQRRKENYAALSAGLRDIDEIGQFQSSHGDYQSSCYCLSALLDETLAAKRFDIVSFLKQHAVGTSVYYPQAVPHFSYYKAKYGYSNESFPVAAWISRSSIALPVGPHVDLEDIAYMVEIMKAAITEVK